MTDLDLVIPVYNEGENIVHALRALQTHVKTSFRVFICYDFDEDNTLPAVEKMKSELSYEIVFVKNPARGPHSAVIAGFQAGSGRAVIVYPADEAYNAHVIDSMFHEFQMGSDVVVASRFMKGGRMEGGPLVKSIIVRVASFVLRWLIGVPATDATYGFRLFSRRILDTVRIESTAGFTYAVELLVKCHRLRWRVSEVPALWVRRTSGESRFRLGKWLPHYGRWFFYAFETTYLRRPPQTVLLKE